MRLLVTGAGGGIGAGVLRAASAAGHEVVAHVRRPEALQSLPGGVTSVVADLARPGDRAALAGHAAAAEVEAVIATHGVTGALALEDLTPAAVARIMEVNTISTIELAELCAEPLRKVGGTFVATASQAGLRPERENSIYCASKWALVAWAREAQKGASRRGYAIRVLCPGRTDAPMLHEANSRIAEAQQVSLRDYERSVLADLPLGRVASVEEIAAAALFLAAPMSAPRPALLAVTGGEVPY